MRFSTRGRYAAIAVAGARICGAATWSEPLLSKRWTTLRPVRGPAGLLSRVPFGKIVTTLADVIIQRRVTGRDDRFAAMGGGLE